MKKLCSILLSLSMSVSLAACSNVNSDTKSGNEAEKTASPASAQKLQSDAANAKGDNLDGSAYTVAVLADGAGFGTQSFNDVALAGAERAKTDFNIKVVQLEVSETADIANGLRNLAQQGVNMIITPSSTAKDAVETVSEEYPDTWFAVLDISIDSLPNVVSAQYREQEAAFLLGYLGAKLSQSHKLGYVGGIDGIIQQRCVQGYAAGAKYADKNVEVTSTFTGSFSDVGKGKEIATSLYNKGIDYIAPFAGACNLGVFQAAKEAGADKWSFGAANGQFEQMPDKIVASQVKRIDNVAYTLIKQLIAGELEAGHHEYGLKEGGVDLMYSPETAMSQVVSDALKQEVETLRSDIIAGKLVCPATAEQYESFLKTLS